MKDVHNVGKHILKFCFYLRNNIYSNICNCYGVTLFFWYKK